MSYHRNKDTGFKSALFFDYYKSDNNTAEHVDRLSLGKEGRLKPNSKSSDHNLNEFNLISKDLLDEIEDSYESKQRSTLSTLRNSSEIYQSDGDDFEKSRSMRDFRADMIPNCPFTTKNANIKSIDDISFFPKSFNVNNYKNSNGIINPTNTLTRNIPAYMPNFSKTPVLDSRSFMYGKIGWICSMCKNFNYESNLPL